jgi:hypothetical protein
MGQPSVWMLARMIWYYPTDSYQKIFGSFPARLRQHNNDNGNNKDTLPASLVSPKNEQLGVRNVGGIGVVAKFLVKFYRTISANNRYALYEINPYGAA